MLVAKKRPGNVSFYDEQMHKKKTSKLRHDKARLATKRMAMLGAVAALALTAISLVAHFAMVIQVNYQIDNRTRELFALQESQQHLKLEIASLRSPDRLEKIALEEIGLQYPDHGQFIILTARRSMEGGN